MEALILVGLFVAVLFTVIGRGEARQPQPPQIIYVQAVPTEPAGGAGCLPVLLIAGVALMAILLFR